MNKLLLIGLVIVVVAALASYLILIHHSPPAIVVNVPYAFIIQSSNGSWVVEWFSTNGSLHTLGPFGNLNNLDILNAMNVVNQFNQQVVPQHTNYQPLDSIIVVGAGDTGKQGVVEIPVSGNTIELNQVNPGYYTLVAVPQQYATQFMQALDTGYKLSGIVGLQGANYLEVHDQKTWKLVLETINLMQYSPQNVGFGSSYILVTNNNTLIPYAPLRFYGLNLSFVNTNISYNGS